MCRNGADRAQRVARKVLCALAIASAAGAQTSGQSAFVFRVGTDTIGIERFSSSPGGVSGQIGPDVMGEIADWVVARLK